MAIVVAASTRRLLSYRINLLRPSRSCFSSQSAVRKLDDEQVAMHKRTMKRLDRTYFDINSHDGMICAGQVPADILKEPLKSNSVLENAKHAFNIYAKLSKLRLATLVTLTTMAGYSMNPSTCLINSPALLLWTTLGTSLCITSANTINQLFEIEHDAKMQRTKSRILPSGQLDTKSAWTIAVASGLAGSAMLYEFVNPVTALLGFGNILLYTCVYTPMKRHSVYNTHVGSLVGAIPPLMGWTAVSNGAIIGDTIGGLAFVGILFAWQFPHFNALSHNIRHDYLHAGYKMMANADPVKNAAISLRWTAAMFPLSVAMSLTEVTTDLFTLTSMVPNSVMMYYAYRFWRNQREERERSRSTGKEIPKQDQHARNLFLASLFHMPAIVLLALFHKKHWYHQGKHDDDKNNNQEQSLRI